MSNGVIIAIISGGLFTLTIAFGGVGELISWLQKHAHENKPKEKAPEFGALRVVEKMDKAGELYYVAEKWGWRLRAQDYDRHDFTVRCDTPEEAQDKANARIDAQRKESENEEERTRRRNYSKVMGEFKP